MGSLPTIGFIGLGVMGRSMAGHLQGAGYPLVVYNRTRERARELVERGATWQDSPGEVARSADVVITIVGYPADVEAVYFGEAGLVAQARVDSVLIDMTTSTPRLAQRIYEAARGRGVSALDAPVSGGDVGAREARLTIMVGGDAETYERVLPIFQVMGKSITRLGGPGAGQHTKMCNQIAIAAGMIGVSEALAYAKAAGLDQTTVLKTIETGAAGSWSLSNYGPRMIGGDFKPGFYVKHFIKDMDIALQAAQEMELDTPGLKLARTLYGKLAEMGEENRGTHALFKLWQTRSDRA